MQADHSTRQARYL